MNYLHLLHSVFMKLTSFGLIGVKISFIMWSCNHVTKVSFRYPPTNSPIYTKLPGLLCQMYICFYCACLGHFLEINIFSLKYWSIFFSSIFIEFSLILSLVFILSLSLFILYVIRLRSHYYVISSWYDVMSKWLRITSLSSLKW